MFHNSEFGHSPLQLLKKDRAWLVSSWHAIFNKKPILDEEFTVNTWPYKFKGVFGNWSQTMTDKNGQILAATDSVWFYFNTKKEAPQIIDKDEMDSYEFSPAYEMNKVKRKIICKEDLSHITSFPVSSNHLDTNRHVNNCQYIRMALDYIPIEYTVTELQVEYRLAAKYGDIINVYTNITNDIMTVIFNNENNNPYFLSKFRIKRI